MDRDNSQFNLICNVAIRKLNLDTGEETIVRRKNRATKLALLGIAKLIYGTFNSGIEEASYYVPKYIGLGSGNSSVTVDDTSLDNEFEIGDSYQRQELATRNIDNSSDTEYIRVSFSAYIPSNQLQETIITEAGLFTNDSGSNCFARITFSPLEKGVNEVIDIKWDITLVSVSNT